MTELEKLVYTKSFIDKLANVIIPKIIFKEQPA